MRWLRSIALVVVVTVLASLAWARTEAKPASAASTDVTSLLNTLDDGTANSIAGWTQGLGQIGKLADALPAVQTSAGSVLGFNDLLDKWLHKSSIFGANALSDLQVDPPQAIDLGDGRTGTLDIKTSTAGNGDEELDVAITASKTVSDQPLSIPLPVGTGSNAPQSSFSSTGGISVTASASLNFSLVWEHGTTNVYMPVSNSTPSLQVDATAKIDDASKVKAAIGILGVTLANTSSLSLAAHFVGSVSDPNNDGKLSFDAADGGELAQAGSLAGLVSFGFASPAGDLNAHLDLTAAATTSSLSLPAINASIDWNWPDISTAPPAPTATGIDVAGKFLNMSPKDIIDGIGQAVTSLTMIQQAKKLDGSGNPTFGDLNLPFLKGSLSDVVKINEILQSFLKDWTFPPCADPPTCSNDPDPSKAGQPKFASLQDFLDALNGESAKLPGGETLSVTDVGWQDPTTMNHLSFTLNLTRPAPSSPITLDAAAAASTGGTGSTYTQTTLTDTSQNWTTDEWKGHHVVAGNSGGTIASNDAHTLTLATAPATSQSPANPGWSPTIPAADSAYAISGNSGDVGNVELGDSLLSSGKGISGANAVNSSAMVTPSYEAHLTFVLDLTPPTFHDPPLEVDNPDGSKTLESSTPIGADRVLIDTSKTDLFHADFPIDAGIDINANAGFLQVELKGSLHVGTNPSDSTDPHMLQVSFKDNGLLTFGQLVQDLLNDPTSLLDVKINVGASGSVDASAPGTSDLLGGGTAKATFTWNDLTQTSGSDGPQFDTSQLNPFANFDFDPSNPKALYSIVLKTLQTLDSALGSGNPSGAGSDIFTKPIPVIGKSLSDLLKSDQSGSGTTVTFGTDGSGNGTLTDSARSDQGGNPQPNAFPQSLVGRSIVVGTQVAVIASVTDDTLTMSAPWAPTPSTGTSYMVRSELDDAISLLQAQPPDNLQALIKTLNDRFKNSSPIQFEYRDDSSVGSAPSLVINLDWMRNYDTSAPVNFNFNLPSGSHQVAGVQGSGSVSLGISGEIKVGLVVALAPGSGPADANALQVLDNSGIHVKLDAGVDDATLTTTLGPLNVSLGDPKSSDKGVAHASYSVDLAKSGATDPGNAESFSQFLSDVSPGVDQSSDAVQSKCGTGFDGEATDLALCARLPIYFSTDGGTTYNKLITCSGCSDEFDVRLPKDPQGGAGAADVIDPTGSDIDGHPRIDTPDPTALGNAIASTFDFSNFSSIDGFLNLLQQSLNTASFGGKLPLIGNDLQQGADFLGTLKTTIDSTLGTAAGIKTVGDLRDYVNKTLKNALSGSQLNPTVALETQCADTLASAGAPTVALHSGATAGTTTYTYEIVSYVSDGSGGTLDAQPGPSGDITTGPATLSASNSLDVSWTAVSGAEGYKVYKDTGGGTFELLKDVGNVTTFTDDGSITPSDAPTNPSGPNPKITNCSFDQLDTVIVKADVSVGKFKTVGDHEELDCGNNNSNNCMTEQVPLNIGIPGLSLTADKAGDGPSVQLGYHLHLAFGISKSDGFFIATKDDPQPEFAVGLNFTLPSKINAQLAFINISAQNCDNTMTQDCVTSGSNPDPAPAPNAIPSLFDGTFSIDMLSPNDPTNGHLSLADISNLSVDQMFDIKLHAAVNIDWLLKATVAAPGTNSTAGFPGIQTEFRLKWSFDNVKPGTDDQTSGDNSPLSIEFDKVAIDAGQIFGHIIGPVVTEIKKVTGPLDPIVKTLYAPIPVLSDLSHLVGGGDITIITIAQAFSTLAGGPDLSFVKTIANLVTFINELPSGTDDFLIPIGSFKLVGSNALNDTATPDNTSTLIDQNSEQLDSSSDSDGGNILGALDQHDEGKGALLDPAAAQDAGFSFPVFQKPASLFNLIMGGDVDLVKFDSGSLSLGFDWRQEFGPVYAPPPVLITLHGSASVTLHIVAGFDTYGIRKAFEAAKAGTLDFDTIGEAILQSLFFYTNDANGKPMPVVSFTGEIAAGAEVSVVLITVGIEGGVGLTVSFLWNDPNHDGKFRISEFLATVLNNPICLFSVSGQLFVFLKLYVAIGIGPFAISFSFTIVNVTLLDFSATPDCSPPPPKLGALGDGGHTLLVYAGAFGHAAQRGDASYEDNNEDKETVKITEIHDYTDPNNPTFKGIAIDMLGVRREFDNPNIDRVIVDGIGYAKPMNITFLGDGQTVTNGAGPPPATASFDKDAIVFGGSGDDQIKTGIGNSWVDGGGGNDTIVTGDRTVLNAAGTDYLRPDASAIVAGGPGDDSITVGNGNDVVAGDSTIIGGATTTITGMKELVDSKDPSVDQTEGDPSVAAPDQTVPDWTALAPSSGENGTDGKDTVNVGLGKTTLYGNGGDDTLGVSTDNALLAAHPAQASLFHSQGVTLVGGTGNNHIVGGAGDDTIYAGQQWPGSVTDPANFAGVAGDGNNVVDTGNGNDTVYGGSGDDLVTGHSVHGGADTMYGGDGSDVLIGGDGADQVFGGPGDDYLSGGPAKVDPISPADPVLGAWKITQTPDGNTVDHKLLVGGDGADHVYGSSGGDNIFGDRQEDQCALPSSGPRSTPPPETNSGSPGNDYIVGGNGENTIQGGGGNDTIFAGKGNDLLCGGAGDDALHGGPGNDTMFGGSGNDLLLGGGGNSALYGNDGNDSIYGGNGKDWIEGNDGSDFIVGGAGPSVIIGGTSAAAQNDEGDTIEGGTGDSIIIGDNGIVDANSGWPSSGAPYVTPVVVHEYDLDVNAPNNTLYGGNDTISGGAGNDQIYGGLGDDFIVGGTGLDHIEGGPGSDLIYGGSNNDDILGGTSPLAVAGGSVDGIPDGSDGQGHDVTPATLTAYNPVIGNTIFGYLPAGGPNPMHHNVIVGGNGSITPTGVIDPNSGAPIRAVQQLALLTVGGNDAITGGPGSDQIFGGLGDDLIHTGNGDNYVEGGPGSDGIYGGTGNNDMIGGTSPLSLPTSGPDALTTAQVPDGGDTIYADGLTAQPASPPPDGSNVVLADNGCISRGIGGATTDANGCPTGPPSSPPMWQFSAADPTSVSTANPNGVLVRPVIRQLDVFDCPNSSCGSQDVQGAGDHVWGGYGDDLLFGETGNDEVYGGPPGTNGINGTAGTFVGNDYMEGGAGSDIMAGGAGDDDMIGGSAPTYLPPGTTTAMISDGTLGGSGFTLAPPANAQLKVDGSGVVGNTMDGGGGNDMMLGGNGSITHVLSSGTWARNPNDQAFIRTPVDLDLLTIGGDDTMRGGPGDDKIFGGLGNDYADGGTGDDYIEGGPGRDVLQGGANDDDIVGGTSPIALPAPPAGLTNDQVAANTPDGTPDPDPTHLGQRLGNIVCGFYCGQSTNTSDDDAITGNNARIDRCPAVVTNGVGVPQGSDTCVWTRTSYGNEKTSSAPGVAQSGAITATSLGNPRARYVTLLGQSPTDTTADGNDYVEGDSGNDVIYGEDGNDSVHGDTPAPNSLRLDECLPTSDANAGQDVIVGGYGNDVLCGDGGDDGIVGNRALVTVVPFAGAATTIGQTGGAPYGTFSYPGSGNSIYRVDLSQEYVNGVLTPIPNWNNPSATGQSNQHDIIFGGQGNDSLHGSPGGDFIEGDDGMHIKGQPASSGGDDILFGDGGNDSLQGGPGNDHQFGGDANDDTDVVRSDTGIALKVDDSRTCLPMAFPTITADPTAMLTAEGCPTTGFGIQSYASRFPLVSGTYDSDPGALDNGGNVKNTTLFGDIMYGGFNRDVYQSQSTGAGDRMIDDHGAFNLEYLCPASYGGYQINRAMSPNLRTFIQQLTQADGAVNTSTPTSSGGVEASIIYSTDNVPNIGPDYPTNPGHFTC